MLRLRARFFLEILVQVLRVRKPETCSNPKRQHAQISYVLVSLFWWAILFTLGTSASMVFPAQSGNSNCQFLDSCFFSLSWAFREMGCWVWIGQVWQSLTSLHVHKAWFIFCKNFRAFNDPQISKSFSLICLLFLGKLYFWRDTHFVAYNASILRLIGQGFDANRQERRTRRSCFLWTCRDLPVKFHA